MWTEARGREVVYARSGGLDEILGNVRASEWSHRLARRHALGGWRPSNGLHLHPVTHAWLHQNPAAAYAGGWHIRDGHHGATAPERVPVWLALPWRGWWLLHDEPGDGGPPLLTLADTDRPPPATMPPTLREM
jgi:hypothetical protein